jgi:hypothetical protein
MMAASYYWWKREPRYIIQCIWEETIDLPQVNPNIGCKTTHMHLYVVSPVLHEYIESSLKTKEIQTVHVGWVDFSLTALNDWL